MLPRYKSILKAGDFVGGFERFDLYVTRYFQHGYYLYVVWGSQTKYIDLYRIHGGKLRLQPFMYRDRDFPTQQEKDGIMQYLHLFVPYLNIAPRQGD